MMKQIVSIIVIMTLVFPMAVESTPVPPVPLIVEQALLKAGLDAAAVAAEWEYIFTTLTTLTAWYEEAIPAAHWLRGGTPAKLVADSSTIHGAIVEVIESCRAAATAANQPLQTFLRSPGRWTPRTGAINLRLLLTAAAIVVTATVSFAGGYIVSKEYHQAKTAIFESKAKEDAAFGHALGLIYEGLQAGRVELEPGLELEDAIRRIRVNMEVGRAPFVNVLEPRPCPSIAGPWVGELQVKEVRGDSRIQVGASRTFKRNGFVLSHGDDPCAVRLKMGGSEISGYLVRSITPVARVVGDEVEREELDTYVLDENATGSLKRAELTLYGLGSGLLKGKLKVEVEQIGRGGTIIVSGGILDR